jgi:hypothetical protein
MLKICGLIAISMPLVYGVGWGRFNVPKPIGLHQLVTELQTNNGTAVSGLGISDQINALIEAAGSAISHSQSLVDAQLHELEAAEKIVNQTVAQVEANENARVGVIKEYNKEVMEMNQALIDMTTGSQQVNDVISVANRIKTNLANDIRRLNEAIMVVNDWMVKMDSWVVFVKDESASIDMAQANLLKWGDTMKGNINTHEVSAVKLAREAYDLETQIMQCNNFLLGTGELMGYTPETLSIPEAAGGVPSVLSFWS